MIGKNISDTCGDCHYFDKHPMLSINICGYDSQYYHEVNFKTCACPKFEKMDIKNIHAEGAMRKANFIVVSGVLVRLYDGAEEKEFIDCEDVINCDDCCCGDCEFIDCNRIPTKDIKVITVEF